MKNILIINGHPKKGSFCNVLSDTYCKAAAASGNNVVTINLYDLKFDVNLEFGFTRNQELEPDIVFAQEKIKWANHIVIVHPVWWGSVPAILKGFFDKTLLPGFAFKYRENSAMWDKLLSDKTARIIYTADTPIWIYKCFFGAPSVNQVKKRTLEFCGVKPVKVTAIGPVRKSSLEFRKSWIDKIEVLGRKGE